MKAGMSIVFSSFRVIGNLNCFQLFQWSGSFGSEVEVS